MTKTKNPRIVPRKSWLLVKPDEAESRVKENGLIIPTNVEQERKAVGTVIEVGSEIKDIKKGNKVVYGVYAGEEMKMREKGKEVEYKFLHDDDVIGLFV